jgi:hypothetical protein
MAGNSTGIYNKTAMISGIEKFNSTWREYANLRNDNSSSAVSSLYILWGWGYTSGPSKTTGAYHSVYMSEAIAYS